MPNKNNVAGGLGMIAAGAAVGYIAGLFISPKVRYKHKEFLLTAKDKIATKVDWDEASEKIFGTTSDELKAKTKDLVNDFQHRWDQVKSSVSNVNTQKYKAAIASYLESMENQKDLTREQSAKLRRYLESDYRKIATAARS